MFWKKRNKAPVLPVLEADDNIIREAFPYPERECWLYISDKYEEVLLVPMGRIDPWSSKELNDIIVGNWPMNIGDLQTNIIKTLNKWKDKVKGIEPNKDGWHSFNISKAKTQRSFKVDYVYMSLTTDIQTEYGAGEAERIMVKASPFDTIEDRYELIGKGHLINMDVAQIVIDIFKACSKIRS